LDGRLRPVPGALSVAVAARENGAIGLVVPRANAREAALAEGLTVLERIEGRRASELRRAYKLALELIVLNHNGNNGESVADLTI